MGQLLFLGSCFQSLRVYDGYRNRFAVLADKAVLGWSLCIREGDVCPLHGPGLEAHCEASQGAPVSCDRPEPNDCPQL